MNFPIPGTPSKRTIAANDRNLARIHQANTLDQGLILGESPFVEPNPYPVVQSERPTPQGNQSQGPQTYLPADPSEFLPDVVHGPDDSFTPPPWFLKAVEAIAGTAQRPPSKPPFRFEATIAAAEYNGKILARSGFDIGRVLAEHKDTTLGYGCEFRSPAELKPLLGRHRHFKLLEDLLRNGMSYFYKVELTEAERVDELNAILQRGNHKSATNESKQVSLLLEKDVTHGFSVPVPVDTIRLIPGAAVQPLGMAVQQTLDENGEPKTKFRLTQDLSFSSAQPPAPPRSINKRIDMSLYPEMVFGWCLQRILHFVSYLRWYEPLLRILMSKYDHSDAYRRIAHSASAAL